MHGRQKRKSRNHNQKRTTCAVCGTSQTTYLTRVYRDLVPLCPDCRMLSENEVDFRMGLAELKRCRTWDGFIIGKKRRRFEKLLNHRNSRVIELAKEMELEHQFRSRISAASKDHEPNLDLLVEDFQTWLDGRVERIAEACWEHLED